MSDLDLEMLRGMHGEPERAADEVERLRTYVEEMRSRGFDAEVRDENERLRAENKKLQAVIDSAPRLDNRSFDYTSEGSSE